MFKVFYSWLSDREKSTNRVYISRALKVALEELFNGSSGAKSKSSNLNTENFEIIECGSKNKAGDILSFITTELPRCHVHVVDLTFINNPEQITDTTGKIKSTRRTPNPNNMFELGFSFNCLGVNKVIPVFNKFFGNVSDLPFDVRGLNVIEYSHEGKNVELKNSLKLRLSNLQEEILNRKLKMLKEYKGHLKNFMWFFEDFIRAKFGSENLINESIKTLSPNNTTLPKKELVEWLLNDLATNHLQLDQSKRWGHRFLIYLRCLSADCRRITTEYYDQEFSLIYKNIKGLGLNADSLEIVLGRVLEIVPEMLRESLIIDEVNNFLLGFKQSQVEVDLIEKNNAFKI